MREITRKNSIKNRERFIVDICKNKKVLHLGCCDSPFTEYKYNKGIALFQRIEQVCSIQKGLDIDSAGIDYLKTLGHENIDFYDLNQSKEIDFAPDVIVFADTLEHLMNLEVAISSLKNLMDEKTELIITVPNATMLSRVIGNFRGRIKEHEDHKVSFTYSALKQLLEFNHLTVNNIFLAGELNIDNSFRKEKIPVTILRAVYTTIYKGVCFFFPLFSESLIITCSLKNETETIIKITIPTLNQDTIHMNWKLKAFIQNTLSFFSSEISYRLYYFLQRKFGGLKIINPVSELTKAIDTWRAITNQELTPKNKTFFEVGTGRISLVPLAYWLMGAKKTITIDINPYLKSELIKESLEYISKNKEEMLTLFGEYLDIGRWEKLLLFIETSNFSTATFLNLCKITYIAPGDAAKTNLPNKSIDFHTSSTVFEHIPIETLEKILIEGNRIIKNNGHFFHDIDYSDHFSHSDSSISAINFLSFSDKEWDKYARNRYMYMNRMRHDDFLDLFQKVGHNILEDRVHIDKISQNILKDEGFLLDDKFKNKSIETLSISRAWITSCKSVIK